MNVKLILIETIQDSLHNCPLDTNILLQLDFSPQLAV